MSFSILRCVVALTHQGLIWSIFTKSEIPAIVVFPEPMANKKLPMKGLS